MTAKQFYSSKAWKYLSRYTLLYYANKEGIVQCSTSGVYMSCNSSKMHCGHYIKVFDGSKTNMSVALDFENLAPQSHKDNIYGGGKPDIMREWLINKHGIKKIEMLNIKKHNICKLGKFELDYFGEMYKRMFNELVDKKGINPWILKHY